MVCVWLPYIRASGDWGVNHPGRIGALGVVGWHPPYSSLRAPLRSEKVGWVQPTNPASILLCGLHPPYGALRLVCRIGRGVSHFQGGDSAVQFLFSDLSVRVEVQQGG